MGTSLGRAHRRNHQRVSPIGIPVLAVRVQDRRTRLNSTRLKTLEVAEHGQLEKSLVLGTKAD